MNASPTLAQVRKQWTGDLHTQGLLLLESAARAGKNSGVYIRTVLQDYSETMDRGMFNYFYSFVMHHASSAV